MVVDLYHAGQSVRNLSSEYGVSEVTIYTWIKKFTLMDLEDGSSITPDDYANLQKQMLKLQEENDILKKLWPYSQKVNHAEITDFIDQEKENYAIQAMDNILDVPRSTHYKTISNRDQKNKNLTKRIIENYDDSNGRYGAPKIHHILNEEGYQISVNRVQRLMRKANIKSIIVKVFRPTPSKEKVVECENILKRDFTTNALNEKWVTYIHTLRHGWCYLASVMDLPHQRNL